MPYQSVIRGLRNADVPRPNRTLRYDGGLAARRGPNAATSWKNQLIEHIDALGHAYTDSVELDLTFLEIGFDFMTSARRQLCVPVQGSPPTAVVERQWFMYGDPRPCRPFTPLPAHPRAGTSQ